MSVQRDVPAAGGAVLHAPPPLPRSLQDEVAANIVLTELTASHTDVSSDDGALQIKRSLPPSRGETATQPQKLNKRRYSMNVGFKHPGFAKRRRRANSECDPVLPTNFLLGGNIFDPLNLNSLLDEEVSKALNAETPRSSPLPSKSREPVEILIPKDITDPLNLNGSGGDAAAGVLVSPLKSRRRHRNRHHPGAPTGPADGAEGVGPLFPLADVREDVATLGPVDESPRPYELNTSINCRDEVVPPILPRRRSHPPTSALPSRHRKRRRTASHSERLSITPTPLGRPPEHSQTFHTPVVGGASGAPPPGVERGLQQRRPKRRFHYGNYSHCYSYRTPSLIADPRLAALKPEWFRGKKVLDVGCNTGHVTLAIARHWGPERILGLDVDDALVHVARQNLRHFLSELQGVSGEGSEVTGLQLDRAPALPRFPISFTRFRGPIAAPPIMPHVPGLFPCNVSFLKGDYILDCDAAVMSQCAEYDVILCLSLTKWVHLNHGDAGIQRLFRRVYRHLLPGGVLILEPQPWSSYGRRKRLTDLTYRNYSSIRLKPDQFSSFLTNDVGFSSYEVIGTPHSFSTGFQRSIYLFHKGSTSNRK